MKMAIKYIAIAIMISYVYITRIDKSHMSKDSPLSYVYRAWNKLGKCQDTVSEENWFWSDI